MEQLGFEGMPRRLYPCTPTRLYAWLDCPRRYRMSYLDRPPPPKGPPWAHNSLGASIHNALAGWWRLAARAAHRRGRGHLAGPRLDRRGFRRRDPVGAAPRARRRHGGGLRRRAGPGRRAARRGTDGGDPHGQDRGLRPDRPPRRPAIRGRASRPWRNRGRGRGLQDRAAPADRGRRAQLDGPSAVRAGRRAGAAPATHRVELHHLPTGEVLAWSHTDESLARHLGRAEDIAEECAAADERMRDGLPADSCDEVFPPRPGPYCGWCDYRRHCPEGAAAAPARRPWDGLSAD